MQKSRRFPGGRISLKTGHEGSKYDPYSYQEYTCYRTKGDNTATLHLGLATWLKVNGKKPEHLGFNPSEASLVAAFEYFCGISLKTFQRTINRHSPCCEKPSPRDVDGYPGEILTVCENCGSTIDFMFDDVSIM